MDKKHNKRQERKALLNELNRLNKDNRYWARGYGRSLETTKKIHAYVVNKHERKTEPLRAQQRARILQKLNIDEKKNQNLTFEQIRQQYIARVDRLQDIHKLRDRISKKAEVVRTRLYPAQRDRYLNKAIDNKQVLANIIRNAKVGDRLVLRSERNGKSIYRNISNADPRVRDIYIRILTEGYDQHDIGILESATDLDSYFLLENNPTLLTVEKNRNRNKAGLYFDYYNTTDIDLTKYQIYREEQNLINNEHCLIHTLRNAGIENNLLSRIGTTFKQTNHFLKKDLYEISTLINKKIILHEYDTNNQLRNQIYENDEQKDIINIALYKNHYFTMDDTKYTYYSSRNYIRCSEYKNPHNITALEKRGDRIVPIRDKKTTTINSITLIHNLFKSNIFKKIEYKKHLTLENVIDMSGIQNEQRPYIFKEKIERKNTRIFYADTETTRGDDGKHSLFLTGIIDEKDEYVFLSKSYLSHCDMFNYIIAKTQPEDYIICYFHNLKYDSAVISSMFRYIGSVEKSGNIYSIDIRYRGRRIHLHDSYKLIPMALKNFKDTFNLNIGKADAIGYSYYSNDTKNIADITEYSNHLHQKDIPIFLQALLDNKKLFDYNHQNNTFDCIEYYKYYLSLDVLVLREGLRSFTRNLYTLTEGKIKVHNFLTCSSIGHYYASMHGVYNGCYEITGNLRAFISKAISGGRVYTNSSFTKKEIKENIAYLDIVSLYPASMERLSRTHGFVTGSCTYFIGEQLPPCTYAIIQIQILRINKQQQMPFISIPGEENIIYTNTANNNLIYIDTITLEDYKNFHEIEYKIIDGVYWTGEFNKNIGAVILKLTEERNRYKLLKNDSMSTIIKLIMNSIYGRTILKMSNTTVKYVDDFNYIISNFDNISSYYNKGYGQYRVKMNKMDNSYNLGHIGTCILSMSKRVMNEIMNIANDHKINCYYQDTDSIHLDNNKINILNEEFKNKYGYYILGNTLGLLQHDFKLENCTDIIATKAIFLGRKSYIDVIQGIDRDTKELKTGYHYRLKGIPNKSILYEADRNYDGDIYELYKDLSKEKIIEFVLNPTSLLPSFDFKNGAVYTRPDGSFKRVLSF